MVFKLRAGSFYGVTAKTINISGFRFTEKSYETRIALPSHSHELAHFCFVLEGNYTETICRKIEERTPATLIFYPPDTVHAEGHHNKGRHLLIELEPWRARSILNYGAFRDAPLQLASPGWLAAKIYREFRDMDELSMLALEGMALELVVEALRHGDGSPERTSPKWLDQARQILETCFADPPSLQELAKTVGVHPVHLARVFRKFQHCTIGEYVRRLRVEHARQQMLVTNIPLVEIALSSGFADHTHFSRSFKRVTGMTPTEFRKIIRRG
ncbi:MAG: AraC family transcriptional regulator [Acidobacteriota bacterium]|jgi:AraC family transcriptional regulator|nr:AraC family transcriptional regulator [Acidobacteriota bacterium]